MPRYSYGDTKREQVWTLLKALLAHANNPLYQINWQKENNGNPKLEVKATLAELSQLTKKVQEKKSLSIEDVREVLSHYLKSSFLNILQDNRRVQQGKGSENWHFILTLWSKKLEENQQHFNKEWERKKSKESEVTEASSTNEDEKWLDICRTMLEKNKRLTTNELLFADEDNKFELNEIHVPLALVERTKREKRSGDTPPEEGSQLYEPSYEDKQRFSPEDFLVQVLHEGVGKTKGKRIALIGEPGAGKTTLLQTIAFWELDKNRNLPIWISLANLQSKSIEEYLLQNWLKDALEVTHVKSEKEDALAELFKKNKVLLLLDGADEMSSKTPLNEISQQLTGWVKNARVVLSCRLNVWEANMNALTDFETYRLLDFDYPEQVQQFIDKWFKSKTSLEASKSNADRGSHKGERLWDELNQPERQRIQDLVKNPLRLALLCATWKSSDKGLPKTKAGLYHLFTKQFYTWKENRFPTTEQQQESLNLALSNLAKRAIDIETSRFRLRHKLLKEELGDPKQEGSNFWLALRLGWLNKVGLAAESDTEEEVYAFYHPTFQEYFAALAMNNWHSFLNHVPENPSDCNASYRIFKPQWKEVILLWFGRDDISNEYKEEFIKALVDFKDGCGEWSNFDEVNKGFYEFQAYFLAAQGIAEFSGCPLSNEIVQQIVRYSFGYLNTKTQAQWKCFFNAIRYEALNILPTTNTTKAIEGLIAVIRDQKVDSYTRREAAESLEKIGVGNQTAIEGLIAVIRDQKVDTNTRRQAAESLEKIGVGNQTAIEGLIAVIRDQKVDTNTRRQAAESLEEIDPGNQTAIEGLIAVIHDQKVDTNTRGQAAESLGKIGVGNPAVIEGLITVIRDQKVDSYTRREAAESLEKIGVGNQTAIGGLIAVIHDQKVDTNTRGQAAESLGKIDPGNPAVIEGLIAVIHDQKVDTNTRREVAESLEKIGVGNQTAIGGLIAVIRDQKVDTNTRRQAAESLGKIDPGNQTAIGGLITVIRDQKVDTNTRGQAAESLGKIDPGNQTAIGELITVIFCDQKVDISTRWQAVKSLGKIDPGNQTAIGGLITVIRDQKVDTNTRWQAAESLRKIDPGNQTVIEGLIAVIRDQKVDSYTRRQAAESLEEIGVGNQTVIEGLIAVIHDQKVDSYTRGQAAESLEEIDPGNPAVIEGLIAVIRDQKVDSYTRRQAAESLGKIDPGNQTVIEGLIAVIRDQKVDSYTRRQAAESLGKIDSGNPAVIEGLIAVIRDQKVDSYTRRQAAESLEEIDPGNQTVIEELIAVIRDQKVDSYTRRQAAESLEKIDPGNQTAIEGLIAIIRDQKVDSSTRREAAESLEKIGVGNQTAIGGLIAVIHDQKVDSYTRGQAAESLGKIDPGNQTAIEGLIAVILDQKVDSSTRRQVAESLEKIGVGNQTAIGGLIAVIHDQKVDSSTRREVAESLEEIDPGNPAVIEGLIAVILDQKVDISTRWQAAKSLEKIGVGNPAVIEGLIAVILDQKVDSSTCGQVIEGLIAVILDQIVVEKHMVDVVSLLKNGLSYETYKNNFDLFSRCYQIIWNCANKMTYPKFYEAWFKSISGT